MTVSPTRRQLDLLRYIAGFQEATGGVSPSFREMQAGVQCGAGSATEAIEGLEERGHIRRLPNRARAIELLTIPAIPRSPSGEPLFYLPAPHRSNPPGQGV